MARNSFFGSSVVPFRLVFIMWFVFSIEVFYGIDLGWLGIKPRTLEGLIGIFTAPLIHGSLAHLISNTLPLLFLGSVLFFFYERIGGIVFARCYLITNALVWLLSPRASYHIGASGLIYGLSSFLIAERTHIIVNFHWNPAGVWRNFLRRTAYRSGYLLGISFGWRDRWGYDGI